MNISNIANTYGSPAYIYNLNEVEKSYHYLKSCLPDDSNILYSVKANPHPTIIKKMVELGSLIEVSSKGEIEISLSLGVDPAKLLFTGPGKTNEEIRYASKNNLMIFSVESINELNRFKLILEETQKENVLLLLRINPRNNENSMGLSMTGISSQFGIDEEKIPVLKEELLSLIKSKYINIVGFHFYHGTNITSPTVLIDNFKSGLQLSKYFSDFLGIELKFIDLGGGFGHPFANNGEGIQINDIKEPLQHLLSTIFTNDELSKITLLFETGRFLTASSGQLICKIIDIKESKGKKYCIVDIGINHIGGMSGLNRLQRNNFEFNHINILKNENCFESGDYTIVGPLCTPLDTLSRSTTLQNPNIGDYLYLNNVGAYGLTASLLGFLSHSLPQEVFLYDNKIVSHTRITLNRQGV